jgi:hypothetical protein
VFLLFGAPASADPFSADEPLALELAAPFGAVLRSRTAPEYQDAQLEYRDGNGTVATVPLRVRVRGKSRAAVCDFPPLLLNFRTPDLAGTLFEGEDRLKLVTHCDSAAAYDQYLKLEYLAYRVLSLVTPLSLRSRLVEVSYLDTGRQRDLGTRPGILLEDEGRFAERQELAVVEVEKIEPQRYDPEALALLDVFEFFIGNTDWSALAGPAGDLCCHNVVPYARRDGTLVPVPYDFDSSGLIDAPHALPDARLPIRAVRQRLYRGRCRAPAEFAPAFARFEEQRAAIVALFDERQGLSAKTAERARDYVDAFYAILADAERREKAFFDCAR